jgi:hypothetical protein
MPFHAPQSAPACAGAAATGLPRPTYGWGYLLLLLLLSSQALLGRAARAQGCTITPTFGIQGAATRINGCYRLTEQGMMNSAGAIWNPQPISLRNDFDLSFDINQCGSADGVVFVLQNQGASPPLGNVGGSLGYYGGGTFPHSVGVELDFYQNTGSPFNDPSQPHAMLALNGDPAAVQGPVPVAIGSCSTYTLRVRWTAAARQLRVQFDGTTS